MKIKRPIPAPGWSYMKTSWRKMKSHKGYAFINVAGLAVGLACGEEKSRRRPEI
jgi:hypothetical protein